MAGYIVMGYLLLDDTKRNGNFRTSLHVFVRLGQAIVAGHADFIENFRAEDTKEYLFS